MCVVPCRSHRHPGKHRFVLHRATTPECYCSVLGSCRLRMFCWRWGWQGMTLFGSTIERDLDFEMKTQVAPAQRAARALRAILVGADVAGLHTLMCCCLLNTPLVCGQISCHRIWAKKHGAGVRHLQDKLGKKFDLLSCNRCRGYWHSRTPRDNRSHWKYRLARCHR